METVTLSDVLDSMQRMDSDPSAKIPQEKLKTWMSSQDIQVLGAVYYLLFDERYYPRIIPALSVEDYMRFLLPYYERCFREDPQMDWASTRYTAGWDLVGWFMGLWRDKSVDRRNLAEIKDWLGSVFRSGDEAVRTCLVTATLEHLFEDRKVAKFFADWENDPILREAFGDAMMWPDTGSTSPLGKER